MHCYEIMAIKKGSRAVQPPTLN